MASKLAIYNVHTTHRLAGPCKHRVAATSREDAIAQVRATIAKSGHPERVEWAEDGWPRQRAAFEAGMRGEAQPADPAVGVEWILGRLRSGTWSPGA